MSPTREAILAAQDFVIEEVQAPEWGGSIFVRTLSGTENDAYRKAIATQGDDMQIAAHFIVATACDEKGALIFTEADVPALAKKSAKVLRRIFKAALKVNGIGKEAEEAAEKK